MAKKKQSVKKNKASTTTNKAATKTQLDPVRKSVKAAEKAVEVHARAQKRLKSASQSRLANKIAGFAEFIREKGVVGLAVGLAFGTAATVFVKQIVDAVVTPAVGLLIGKEGLDAWNFTVTIGDRSEVFAVGTLVNGLLQFIAVAAVIYFVVLGLKLDRLDKKKEE